MYQSPTTLPPLENGQRPFSQDGDVLELVARLLWAKSPTAAGGGYREGDFGAAVEIRRSEQRAGEFRVPQEGDQSISTRQCLYLKFISFRGVAQLVARLLWEQDAAGSSPVTSTMLNVHNGLDRYEHSFLCTLVFRAGLSCSFLLCR